MIAKIQKVIEKLGYSKKEVRTYLALLRLGGSMVTDLAEYLELPRTSVQVILEKLQGNNLVEFYMMHGHKQWVATDPGRFLINLKRLENSIKEVLPDLVTLKKQGRKDKKRCISKQDGLLHLFAETSENPVLITNETVEVVYVNLAWEERFGYTLTEVKGQNLCVFSQNNLGLSDTYLKMWKSLEDKKVFCTDEIIDTRKDGTCFRGETAIFPVHHGGGLFYIQILSKKRI
jgi:PAS domain S-box-containing protein